MNESINTGRAWQRGDAALTPRSVSDEQLFLMFIDLFSRSINYIDAIFGCHTDIDIQLFEVRLPDLGLAHLGDPITPGTRERLYQLIPNQPAWKCMKALHQYGVKGIRDADGIRMRDAHEYAHKIVQLFTAVYPDRASLFNDILFLSEARSELEHPFGSVTVERLAALADVDARTVRNAMAAGDIAFKKNGPLVEFVPAAARQWLAGRRGFIPTRPSVLTSDVEQIQTQAEFGQFLASINATLKAENIGAEPPVDSKAMKDLESGLFNLALDSVFPLADYFGVKREAFLKCVMRVFFPAHYHVLASQKDLPRF